MSDNLEYLRDKLKELEAPVDEFKKQENSPFPVFNVRFHGSIGDGVADDTAAIATAYTAAIGGTLYFPSGTYKITGDTTIPATVSTMMSKGAKFVIPTTKTLTINGPFEAGLYQVFDYVGTGKVVFGAGSVKEVYPEWFATNTTPGTTEMAPAITRALASFPNVKLGKTQYALVDSFITLNSNNTLSGYGNDSVIIVKYPNDIYSGGQNYSITGASISNVILKDFKLDKTSVNSWHGIVFNGVNNLLVDNVSVIATKEYNCAGAINLSSLAGVNNECNNVIIRNCYIYGAYDYAIEVGHIHQAIIEGNILIDGHREQIGVEPAAAAATSRADFVTIKGNIIRTNDDINTGTASGLIVVTESTGGAGGVSDINVLDNIVTIYDSPTYTRSGISVYGCTNINISGNQISGTGKEGLFVGMTGAIAPSNIRITNNTIRDCSYDTPRLGGTSLAIAIQSVTGVLISGNIITGSTRSIDVGTSEYLNGPCFGNYCDGTIPYSSGYDHSLYSGGVNQSYNAGTSKIYVGSSNDAYVVDSKVSSKSVSVTGANVKIVGLLNTYGATDHYCGLVNVVARNSMGSSPNTASYLLYISKDLSNAYQCIEIAKAGLTAGGSASQPSFTWTAASNELRASVVGSTTATFYFTIHSITGSLAFN